MRFRKTPTSKRTTYKQYDEDGRLLYEFNPETDTEMTELDVVQKKALTKAMHAIDDAEVRVNCKEIRLSPEDRASREEERDRFIREFEAEHGYKPHPADIPSIHRTFIYLDADTGNEDEGVAGDSSHIQREIAADPFSRDDQETAVECMRRLVQGFTKREKEVYEIVFRNGKTQVYASRQLEISEVRVGQIVKDITRKLKESGELKKHFRTL